MLTRKKILNSKQVLLCLLIMYISPLTKANQRVRQCLAYFFPVYAFASVENQGRIGEVSLFLCGDTVDVDLFFRVGRFS